MTVEGMDLIERRGFAQLAAAVEAGIDLLRDGYVVRVQKDERATQGRRWLLEGWQVPADEPDIALLDNSDAAAELRDSVAATGADVTDHIGAS